MLTRCCDRKSRKAESQTCQKFTLISTTLFCCFAIGLGEFAIGECRECRERLKSKFSSAGLYGNDDFHTGMEQAIVSGRNIEGLVLRFTNKVSERSPLSIDSTLNTSVSLPQTDQLKRDIRHKVLEQDLEEFERATFNQTALRILLDKVNYLQENTAQSVNSLEKILYLIMNVRHDSIGYYVGVSGSSTGLDAGDSHSLCDFQPVEFFERIRWPATIGFLAFLFLLCFALVLGVCRNSRCTLILFSVVGLFCVIICWLLSGIYLSTSVAIGDFCMQPATHFCSKLAGVSSGRTNCAANHINRL